jgi:uncharacterized protein with von Willebrand factor type A (vWA) domain
MPDPAVAGGTTTGRFAQNVMQFCRALRAAGLPVGPGRTLAALEAVEAVGIGTREDFYWTLHAVLVSRREHRVIFDQAFHLFWRNPDLLKRAMQLMLPRLEAEGDQQAEPVNRRVAEALAPPRRPGEAPDDRDDEPEVEVDARLTWSDREILRTRDFEQMSAEEEARARRLIASLRLPIADIRTRRHLPDSRGPLIDMRRTLKRSLARPGGDIVLVRKARRTRPPPLVVLCDISGSMSQYARMLLHFLHAVTGDRDRVFSFVFATRLTNVTRPLRIGDVDQALARVGESVQDWSGGTRIAPCLAEFNRHWGRRVLAQGAVVLLVTDGLERDQPDALAAQMDRLHRSCRRLIWLNPLLRYDAYAPKSQGARAIMPHVDDFRPVHNLASLEDLVAALAPTGPGRPGADRTGIAAWRRAARAA